MRLLPLNLFLALSWAAVTGSFTFVNLLLGFVLGYVVLVFTQRSYGYRDYFLRSVRTVGFILFFLKELVKSNLQVAVEALRPRYRMTPGVIAIPLDARSDEEITLIANLITLTPGTLSLDVSSDRRTLYIHSLYVKDPDTTRREIKETLERRLLKVTR